MLRARIALRFPLGLRETKTTAGKGHRNGLDYFIREKFNHTTVQQGIKDILGKDANYSKVLAVWDMKEEEATRIKKKAKSNGIDIIPIWKMIEKLHGERLKLAGSRDDIIRTIELFSHSIPLITGAEE